MSEENTKKPVIELVDIEKHFGAVIALAGVSFSVYPGECHCLLGDNGAGKSTFIKTMSGVHQPTKGKIVMDGKNMNFGSPRAGMEAGIAMTLFTAMDDGIPSAQRRVFVRLCLSTRFIASPTGSASTMSRSYAAPSGSDATP